MDWQKHRGHSRLARIGGIATMPSRDQTFHRALASILPQVDRLFVYFDKRDAVPDFVGRFPKIVPLLPPDIGEFGSDGKFLGVGLMQHPGLYFCFDDDIFYPPGYVELLASALERHNFEAAVGFHGTRFRAPFISYRDDRAILHFAYQCRFDVRVDEIGSGTLAFHTGTFRPDPKTWRHHTMGDLMVAIEAARSDVPRIVIRRPANFVRPFTEAQPDSLYKRLQIDDSVESAIMHDAIEELRTRWWFSAIGEKSTEQATEGLDF